MEKSFYFRNDAISMAGDATVRCEGQGGTNKLSQTTMLVMLSCSPRGKEEQQWGGP